MVQGDGEAAAAEDGTPQTIKWYHAAHVSLSPWKVWWHEMEMQGEVALHRAGGAIRCTPLARTRSWAVPGAGGGSLGLRGLPGSASGVSGRGFSVPDVAFFGRPDAPKAEISVKRERYSDPHKHFSRKHLANPETHLLDGCWSVLVCFEIPFSGSAHVAAGQSVRRPRRGSGVRGRVKRGVLVRGF